MERFPSFLQTSKAAPIYQAVCITAHWWCNTLVAAPILRRLINIAW